MPAALGAATGFDSDIWRRQCATHTHRPAHLLCRPPRRATFPKQGGQILFVRALSCLCVLRQWNPLTHTAGACVYGMHGACCQLTQSVFLTHQWGPLLCRMLVVVVVVLGVMVVVAVLV